MATTPFGGTTPPQVTAWDTVASFATYPEAHAAVDRLAVSGFPVEEIEIVGSGLRTVERVTGRLSPAGAALRGAGSGAWIGLFVGLLVGLFTYGPAWIGLIVGGLVIGAFFGGVLGLAAGWEARRHGEFSSLQSVVATRYDVIALDGRASDARAALGMTPPPPAPAQWSDSRAE